MEIGAIYAHYDLDVLKLGDLYGIHSIQEIGT